MSELPKTIQGMRERIHALEAEVKRLEGGGRESGDGDETQESGAHVSKKRDSSVTNAAADPAAHEHTFRCRWNDGECEGEGEPVERECGM